MTRDPKNSMPSPARFGCSLRSNTLLVSLDLCLATDGCCARRRQVFRVVVGVLLLSFTACPHRSCTAAVRLPGTYQVPGTGEVSYSTEFFLLSQLLKSRRNSRLCKLCASSQHAIMSSCVRAQLSIWIHNSPAEVRYALEACSKR